MHEASNKTSQFMEWANTLQFPPEGDRDWIVRLLQSTNADQSTMDLWYDNLDDDESSESSLKMLIG